MISVNLREHIHGILLAMLAALTVYANVGLAGDPEEVAVFDIMDAVVDLGRLTAAPPGVPKERLEVLRSAYEAALNDPAADWWSGRIQRGNTDAEEAYIQRIEAICHRENIDVIFPSFDPEMYVFAKNCDRFHAADITVVTPPLESVLTVQDKSRVLQAAERTGFPHPHTCYPASESDLEQVTAHIPPPWVLKPRFSAHGTSIRIAHTETELHALFREMSKQQPQPLVQAYVAGGLKQNFYLVADRDSSIASVFSPRVQRVRREGVRTATAACVSSREMPYLHEVQELVKHLGLVGGFTLQTQLDGRDDIPRLMEINPRLGHNLWFRAELGIPEPCMLISLARGESMGEKPVFRKGVLLLDPLIDMVHLLREIRHRLLSCIIPNRRRNHSGFEALPRDSIRDLIANYIKDYFSYHMRVTSPLNRGYLSDPLPPLSRLARQMVALVKPDPGQLR